MAASPPGWQGPYALYQGTGTPPSCAEAGADFPRHVYSGSAQLDAPDAKCACSCGTPSGGSCSAPVASYFSSGCSAGCGTRDQPIASTCTPLGLGGCGSTRFTIGQPIAQGGGSCTPDATTEIPPLSWGAVAELCATPGEPSQAGCAAGAVCVPQTSSPFALANYCIVRSGSEGGPSPACPSSSPYGVQYVYSTGARDTRGCSPCTCGAPSGATCTGGTFVTYGNAVCGGASTSFPVPSFCTSLGAAQAGMVVGVTLQPGRCAPSGGEPTGSAQPGVPTTICCLQ